MPNPFLFKQIVLFQTIQFSIGTLFNFRKTFLFQAIQFRQTVLIKKKIVKYKYMFCLHTATCQNSSTSNNTVKHKYAVYVSKQLYYK